jgi:hypothetical protein
MALPLLALVSTVAACGDPTSSSPPSSSSPKPAGIEHPTGHGDVVLRIGYEGGFVPVDVVFTNLPTLLITGDGTVYEQAPVPAVYPGPLVAPLNTRKLTEAGMQTVLASAKALGLLAAPRDYTADLNIADAPETVVTVAAGGVTAEHRAYALGMAGSDTGSEVTAARQDLLDFVTAAGDLAKLAGSDVGEAQPLVPDSLRVRATVVDRASLPSDVPPQFVDWPAAAVVRLADAAECAVLAGSDLVAELTAAKQNTYFVEGGSTYSLAAAVSLPGDRAC